MTEAQLERALRMASLIGLERQGDAMSALEAAELLQWRQESPANEALYRQLNDAESIAGDLSLMEGYELASARDRIMQAIAPAPSIGRIHRVHFMRRLRWAAAAVLVLAVTGIGLLLNRAPKTVPIVAQTDIKAPASNKATITLPNGKQIMLDTVANGTLLGGIARKLADGQLVFERSTASIGVIIASNPRNSKAMQVTLPDQTEVWLNAETNLQYATDYNEKERLVTLHGEAYFEVKHNASKPFRVRAGDQTIEDLGTSFNVKAYGNEGAVKTTLLEGVVKINNAISLKPGQQYSEHKISSANTEEVMAWKSGSFYLDGRELGTVANELGRWYDVEVLFANESAKKNTVFGGEMGRDLTLAQAVRVLQKLNVRARLEGKKLIIE